MSGKTSLIDWSTGASLGVLVGLLVGLSGSPVAATVVGALAALLGGVFGLAEKLPAGLSTGGARRLAAFASACVIALVIGVLLRTYHVLSPSVSQLRAQLVEIGIVDPLEQKFMLRFLRFGFLPPGAQAVGKDGESALRAFDINQGILYAANAGFCSELRTTIQRGSSSADIMSLLSTGGPAIEKLVQAIKRLPQTEQESALRAAPAYLCAL